MVRASQTGVLPLSIQYESPQHTKAQEMACFLNRSLMMPGPSVPRDLYQIRKALMQLCQRGPDLTHAICTCPIRFIEALVPLVGRRELASTLRAGELDAVCATQLQTTREKRCVSCVHVANVVFCEYTSQILTLRCSQ